MAACCLLASATAAAQRVFLARQAIGRFEQMQQSSQQAAGGVRASCDIVEVPARKVFDTVKSIRARNTEVRVTKTDDARRPVEFTDGRQIGGIQVNVMGDSLAS